MGDKKVLGVKDLILMTVVAIFCIRQIPNVAPYGASSVVLWIIAACSFFLPLSMVCGELSTGWPEEGGLYVWIREAFGSRLGWLAVFLYICSCMVYFPVMLQFVVASVGFVFDEALASNKVFIGITSMIVFWILTIINIRGMKATKKLINFTTIFGIFVPGAILVLLTIYWLASGHPMATDYGTISNWIPDLSRWDTIVFLSSMMFAFSGMEISLMFAGHTKNPQKIFPVAIFWSALIILALYLVGTFCLNVMFPSQDANIVAGIMQAIKVAATELNLMWLLPAMGVMTALGAIGQTNAWLIGPIYMLNAASGEHHILGKKISELHPKYRTPSFALYVQACLVSFFCLFSFITPSAEAAYWALSAMTILFYFVQYLLVFAAYYKLRITKKDVKRTFVIPGKVLPVILPALGFISIVFALVLAVIPPAQIDMGNKIIYELQTIGGLVVAAIVGDLLYRRAIRRHSAARPTLK